MAIEKKTEAGRLSETAWSDRCAALGIAEADLGEFNSASG
jgi:hypothetical protein